MEVASEWFFDYESGVCFVVVWVNFCQIRFVEVMSYVVEDFGGDGQVEGMGEWDIEMAVELFDSATDIFVEVNLVILASLIEAVFGE